jgi:AIR synthase-related protein
VKVPAGSLHRLTEALRARVELGFKRDVQLAALAFGRDSRSVWFPETGSIRNGDDATALALTERAPSARAGEYVLFAAEGIRAELVASDPWFAGFASVLANVNDIAAMGGRPWAVVDVMFLGASDNEQVCQGMLAGSEAYGVPVVGGHTTRVTGQSMLAVAIVGRAKRLLSSSAARPGQKLVAAVDLRGGFRGPGANFDAATTATGAALRDRLEVLPRLAESGLAVAAKDVSMAGFCGTLVMMLEAAHCGAVVDLPSLPAPPDVDPERWLRAFPSFAFLLAVEPRAVSSVCAEFDAVGVAAAEVGELVDAPRLELRHGGERTTYWDLREESLTGFGG